MTPAEIMIWDREFRERPLFGTERMLAQIALSLLAFFGAKPLPDYDDLAGWTFYFDESQRYREFLDEQNRARRESEQRSRAMQTEEIYRTVGFGGVA